MSSKPSHPPTPASDGEDANDTGNGVAAAVSADEKSSATPPNDMKDESMDTSDGAKAESSTSVATDNPLPSQQQGGGDDQSDAASAASGAAEPKSRPTRSRTRALSQSNNADDKQNGDKVSEEQDSTTYESTSSEEEEETYLDALASTLARLDERAYKRALLRDANSLMEKIVLPMSFPWAHHMTPFVRNAPRDIDEMPIMQTIDDAEHEICALNARSMYDIRQSQEDFEKKDFSDDEDDIPAVARRADQAGEIELVTCAPSVACSGNRPSADTPASESKGTILLRDPLAEPVPSPNINSDPLENEETDLNIPGELSYQLFEENQAKKRRLTEAGMARVKTLLVSVRVESTSSRLSLFNRSGGQERLPLLLPALLPENFKAIPKGKHASRVPAGRSQMIWIEKNSMRASHRVSFKSYLTNEKIENGVQKRPREVAVGIRVNGNLLSSAHITADQLAKDNLGTKRKRADGKLQPVWSTKLVHDALKVGDLVGETRVGKRQCSMDIDEFTKRVLAREVTKEKSVGWNTKITIEDPSLSYVTPRIDCLPSEDGLIHVLCTSPGELPPANVETVLNQASRNGTPVCTVCWRATSVTGEAVSECFGCGVLVHMKCCQNSALVDPLKPKCMSCFLINASSSPQKKGAGTPPSDKSSRRSSRTPIKANDAGSAISGKPLQCAVCPHSGGAMSLLKRGGKTMWVHDVCRIWCDLAKHHPKLENGSKSVNRVEKENSETKICTICGSSNSSEEHNGIIKCAAPGCSVHVHPMCALYLSKCEELGEENAIKVSKAAEKRPSQEEKENGENTAPSDHRLEQIIKEDKRLCKQYSFRFVRCAIPESHYSKKPDICTAVLPVIFCGIHNPNRDRSLYGLYPGGLKFVEDDVMRVPPKEVATNAQ